MKEIEQFAPHQGQVETTEQDPELVTGQQLNWGVSEGGVLTLFGQDCFVFENGNWVIPTEFGPAEVDPEPVSEDILGLIKEDEEAGNVDKIAYVGLSPLAAMRLYLEGALTEEALEASMELPDEIIATEVTLGDVKRGIVVSPLFESNVATYDKDGQIV